MNKKEKTKKEKKNKNPNHLDVYINKLGPGFELKSIANYGFKLGVNDEVE